MSIRSRSLATSVLVALACATAVGCVEISAGESQLIERVEKRFTVSGAPDVRLGTFDGRISVETWDRPEVLVVVEKYGMDQHDADQMKVESTQDGDRVEVRVRDERPKGLYINVGPRGARLIVSVPVRARVDASSGDGRIEVRGLNGDVTVRTGDGSIQLENVTGAVEARSGDGRIEVDGALRRLHVRSGDGRVIVRSTAVEADGEWDISTGDGSVVLEVPEGFGAELEASTGDGRVSVRDVPFSDTSDSRSHRVARGRIGHGGPSVHIRSGDGSIVVRRAES